MGLHMYVSFEKPGCYATSAGLPGCDYETGHWDEHRLQGELWAPQPIKYKIAERGSVTCLFAVLVFIELTQLYPHVLLFLNNVK